MDITISKKQGRVLVAILELDGIMDGSNHTELVDEAQRIYNDGMRDVLIDLSKLKFMNSSGLSAIHRTAALFRGQPKAGEKSGRASLYVIDPQRGSMVQEHVKLLSPQPKVAYILFVASFDTLFEIHTDLNAAVASF
jgi:anti-anti-sigma factor